jgi:hypothetical protein
VRLTLRTLLAYLDDTLEPTKAKAIGQKIAESPTAQELINRIKDVVRRRRLTVPPATGPTAKLDPNTIAEYIDSVLPPEQLAEVEEICLGSDLYLAEIAACHQILTVVLSEPSLVPPTARQRMYGIVKGPEAIPYRKAGRGPAHETAPVAVGRDDADETLLLGLPFFSGQGSRYRTLIPVAILLLLGIGIGFAIWKALPSTYEKQVAQGESQDKKPAPSPAVVVPKPVPDAQPGKPVVEKPADKPDTKTPDKGSEKPVTKPAEATTTPMPPAAGGEKPAEKPEPPPAGNRIVPPVRPTVQGERKIIGKYQSPANTDPSVLLAWVDENTGWKRLFHNNPVYSEDPLVSLPGYHSKVGLNGVDVVLDGDLNDRTPVVILESAAVLHANPDADLDLTLDRGRVIVTKTKAEGPAKVLLRFHDVTWQLTLLEPGTTVAATLGSLPKAAFTKKPDPQDVPYALLLLKVLKGQANLKGGPVQYLAREKGPGYFWDNLGNTQQPQEQYQLPPWFQGVPARSRERDWTPALANLSQNLKKPNASVEVVLSEMLKDSDLLTRILGVFCLGATSDLPNLLEALADESQQEVRVAAIQVLRHWIGLRPENELRLYEALKKKYKSATAEIIMILLHTYSNASLRRPETYEQLIEWLKSDKLPIRQLAHWQLSILPQTQEIASRIPYNPAGGTEQREQAYEQWKRWVPDGKLPLPAPAGDAKPPTKSPTKKPGR